MRLLERPITGWRLVAAIVAFIPLYYASSSLGLSLASISPEVTPVWPPTGISLAVVVLLGFRMWPAVAIGALIMARGVGIAWPAAAAIAVANTFEALVGAWLLRRFGFSPALDRTRDVLFLVGLAAMASTLISATVGVTALCLTGKPWSVFGPMWWTWWVGNGMGDLVFAPALLVIGSWTWQVPRQARVEALIYPFILALTCVIAFFAPWGARGQLVCLFAPVLTWAAIRLGRGMTAVSVAIVATLSVWVVLRNPGYFGGGSLNQRLLLLQTFMGALSGASLMLAASSTQRHRAEESLRDSEARLRVALESGQMGTWAWEIATGRVNWSANMERIHGLPRGSFGGTFAEVLAGAHHDDRERLKRTIARAVEHRTDFHVQYRIVFPNGEIHWVEGRGRLISDAQGKPVRMVGVCMDTTDRKTAEEGLRLANVELRRKNREMEEFVYTVSHDLKSPLVTISGTAGMLLHNGAVQSSEAPGMIGSIEEAAIDMHRRIDDLLELSRLGHTTRYWGPVRTRDVVESAIRAHEQSLEGASVHVSDPLPIVTGDVQLIERAVDNLISNAIKYGSNEGRLHLHVRPGGDSRRPQVRIADRGPGIDARFHQRIFGLFTRLSDRTEGSGVGLALVRKVMEVHGGRAWVESTPGRGAEFVLEFPERS